MKKQKKDKQRITKIKPIINKYNWDRKNFPSEKYNWKKFEKKNVTIALNVLYAKKEKIYPAFVSKHNSDCEKKSYSFNDFKRRKLALSCSQKTDGTIKRNNIMVIFIV